MNRNAVAFVLVEAILRVRERIMDHETIADDFRDDGRSGDGEGELIASDDGLARNLEGGYIVSSVNQCEVGGDGKRSNAPCHSEQ